MQTTVYSNNWPRRMFSFLSTLILTGLSVYLLALLLVNLYKWTIDNAPTKIITTLVGLVLAAAVCSLMAAIFANLQPNVRVSDKGLEVQVFLFWWSLIPWEGVKDIRPVPMIGRYRLVVVRKLTFIHRVIGTMYFAFFEPAFLIGSEIDRYDELVHLIKKKIGKELWE